MSAQILNDLIEKPFDISIVGAKPARIANIFYSS